MTPLPPASGADTALQACRRDLAKALEQQAAASEILRLIAHSPTDTRPVFASIAESALALCAARSAKVFTFDGRLLHLAAEAIVEPKGPAAMHGTFPRPHGRDSAACRAVLTGQTVSIPDVMADPDFITRDAAVAAGFRSSLGVPLLRDGRPIGAIAVERTEPGPFSVHQVALVKLFADQAAIAMETVRLSNQTRQALERQTATAEVLRVLSGSVTDTQPVFDVIAERAARLTGAKSGWVFTFDGEWIHEGSAFGLTPDGLAAARALFPMRPSGASYTSRAIRDGQVMNVADALAETDPEYATKPVARLAGYRSVLSVPMFKGRQVLGAISVNRAEVGQFGDQEVELLRTFADQAAIAIENVRLFKELQDKTRELEIASRHKTAFLANMSHELRTPLNAILGFTRIVLRETHSQIAPKQAHNLEKILASARHLVGLINATLDLTRIEAGRIEITPSQVDVAALLDECLRSVEPLVLDGVQLRVRVAFELPPLLVDAEKLHQILINLLGNAIKFTERGAIEVRAARQAACTVIEVEDTGIGIPADKLEAVFEEFEQIDASHARAQGSTGLGLAIARRLARAMGGNLTAVSALGRGSTFTLTLPLRWSDVVEA